MRKKDPLKLRPKELLYIACEDLDLTWFKEELEVVKRMWNGGFDVLKIAERLERDPDEILVLLIDLARKEKILPRKEGVYGTQNTRTLEA